ncbi:MAG: T9SS type A sorting domain-containing protein [Bacteroidia bacterium]|nr:T9SS type A sorting domain-containing protein [Bacteroidia bacterium]
MKTILFFMLFAFSMTMSVQAQNDEFFVCLDEAPGPPFTVEEVIDLYSSQCPDSEVTVILTTVVSGNDCSWEVIYSYAIKCGDNDLIPLKIDYQGGDNSAPELTGNLPTGDSDLNLCYDEIPTGPSKDDIAALYTDNCGNVNVQKSGTPEGNDCQWSVTYLYIISDDCGNSTNVEISYSGGDTAAPILDKNAELPTGEFGLNLCYDDRPTGPTENEIAALFVDNCGNVNVTKTALFKGDDCGWKGEISYTIQDDCGNFANELVLAYTGGDTEAPVLDVLPDDFTVNCIDEIPIAQPINFTDNCTDGKNKADFADDVSGLGIACEGGEVIRTWTATDECGNSSSHSITITVLPAPPAEFATPQDVSIDCKEVDNFVPGFLYYSNGVEGGACAINGEVQGTADAFEGSCGEFNVNYEFTDECGRKITATQTITVVDSNGPTIDVAAADLNVECDGQGNVADLNDWLASNGGASASDDCGNVSWSNNFSGLTDDCGATGSATVEFTASDDCGNSTKTVATFTIEDNQAPDVTPASDLSVECDGAGNAADLEGWLASYGGATASDVCGSVSWTNDFDGLSDGCMETGSATVTFTATDDCGNSSSTSATFAIVDTTAPVITTLPSDMTVECDGNGNLQEFETWLANNGGGVAEDLCGFATWEAEYDLFTDECGATGSIKVDFAAVDGCGNVTKASASFIIEDTLDPTIDTQASDLTVECDGNGNAQDLNGWLASNGGATASDACSGVTWSNDFNGLSDDCGATGSATVTFTATDDCGNSSSTTATFTIEDSLPPSFESEASDLTVECDGNGNTDQLNAWLASNGGAIAYDQCSSVTWSNNYSGLTDDCGATGSATVEFAAVDECGLVSKTTATFTIVDTTDPTFSYVPADLTLECDQPDPKEDATAVDECGSASVAYEDYYDYTPWQANVEGNGSVDLTLLPDGFSATGASDGNFSGDFYFNAAFTTVKSVTISFDWTFSSNDLGGVFDPLGVFANGELSEIYNGSDNEANGSYSMSLNAGSIFAIGILNNGDAAFGSATVVVSNLSIETNDLECPITECFIRQFTATDECGNTATAEQFITFVDTTPPVIDTPAADLTVECDGNGNYDDLLQWLENNGNAAASDACGNVTWSYICGLVDTDEVPTGVPSDVCLLSDECGATGSVTVTFVATDDCDNYSTTVATFTIEDTLKPTIDVPAGDLTVECDGTGNPNDLGAWLASYGGAQASDQCSGVTWTDDFTGLSDDCGATGSATVTFTATDDCGNFSSTTATFTIEDTTPPSIDTEASDETVECDGTGNTDQLNAWLANNGGASASDLCGDAAWTNDFSALSDECGATGSATVIFTATDDCGNKSTTSATFTIQDSQAPSIDIQASDQTVECDGEGNAADLEAWLANNGGASASDLCSDVSWSYTCNPRSANAGLPWIGFMNVFDLGGGYQFGTGWGVPDLVTEIDTDANTLTLKPNRINDLDPYWYNPDGSGNKIMEASTFVGDNSLVGQSFTFSGTVLSNTLDPSYENYAFIRIFDGGFGLLEQITAPLTEGDFAVTYNNTQAGAVNIQYGFTVRGVNVNPGAAFDDAYNALGSVVITGEECALTDECAATGSTTVTFIATDDCGNSSMTTATFTIEDTTAPVLTGVIPPSENELNLCADNKPAPTPIEDIEALFDEACGDVIVTLETSEVGDDCNWAVMYSYFVTDECGNDYGDVKIYYAGYDQSAPVIQEVPDLTIDCSEEVPPANPEITDNCDQEVDVQYSEEIIPGDCPGNYVVERSWTAIDDCGNSSVETQTITVQDNTAPTLKDGEEIPVGDNQLNSCKPEDIGPSSADILALYEDDCSNVEVIREFHVSGSDCSWIAWVSFQIVDDCGNEGDFFKLWYEGADETAPDAPAAPADVTVQCATDVPAPVELKAVDNCDGEISASPTAQVTPGDCANSFTMVRTWTFTDSCGNSSSVSQTINVNDDTAPDAPAAPADVAAQCASDVPAPVELTAVDNCDGDITVGPSVQVTPGNCENSYTMVRTWTFTDTCGNTSSVSQTITVNDDTAPDAPAAPADVTVECASEVPAPVDLTAVDNCDGDITVSPTAQVTPGDCANTFTMVRTWTFSDSCNNTSSVSQTIIVKDSTAPDAPTAPADVTAQCASEVPAPVDLTAIDNCDGDITVSPTAETTPGNCDNSYTMVRTWTFTDTCGNTSSVSQTITVNDDIAPDAPAAPADVTVECSDDVPTAQDLKAIDNCDGEISGVASDSSDGQTCPETITRTWTFTDSCGNQSSVSQTITVDDTTAPEISCPADMDFGTVLATPAFATAPDSASDNCDDDLTIEYVDADDETYVPGEGFEDPGAVYKFICQTPGLPLFDFVTFTWDGTYSDVGIGQPKANYTPDDDHPGWELKFVVGIIRPDGGGLTNDWVLYNEQGDPQDKEVGKLAVKNSQNNEPAFPDCDANWQETDLLQGAEPQGYNCKILRVECLGLEGGPGVTCYTKVRSFIATDDCGNSEMCAVIYTWKIEDVEAPTAAPEQQDEVFGGVELDFTAYPVPFDKEVTIKYNFDFDSDVTIQVFDTKGLLIYSETQNNYRKDNDVRTKINLSRGGDQVFYVTVNTNRGAVTKKIVSSTLKRR